MSSHKKVSLSEINQSIDTPNNNHFWQNLKAFLGPGALVAVGYMDPGNWITSVVGGASYKYSLLFVILISSLIDVGSSVFVCMYGSHLTSFDCFVEAFFRFWLVA